MLQAPNSPTLHYSQIQFSEAIHAGEELFKIIDKGVTLLRTLFNSKVRYLNPKESQNGIYV